MRAIPVNRLRLPDGWAETANAAKQEVAEIANRLNDASDDQKAEIVDELRAAINSRSRIWSALRAALAQLSHGKCWYCESRQIRSDMPVDHFRPKGAVYECDSHPGYWWLAFEASNYRYACGLCNSPHRDGDRKTLGKGTHFPLIDEARRVFGPQGNLSREGPALLDPTVAADPLLLWFEEDGSIVPKYPQTASEGFYRRALISRDIYNLNDVRIKEARVIVALEVKRQVQWGEKYISQWLAGDEDAYDHFVRVFEAIVEMICESAEFSVAARAFLSAYRDREWIENALAHM